MAKKLKPIHPGEILREEFMLPMGISSNALARAVGVTPARINEIVRERRGISADTALRLARVFGTDAQSWMNLQTNYDIACVQAEAGREIEHIRPWPKNARG
jgi:addiction module HigA family antidote